ncbi:MAG: hypothetical protein HC851_13600 [Acaryochloris sp. RU_4_1]|nr:hypothetical protein [Acaryochloris sp. RU_4_1]NJR55318.1 hypothetical protein [Acaryochloris sp. CRU_2_0]
MTSMTFPHQRYQQWVEPLSQNVTIANPPEQVPPMPPNPLPPDPQIPPTPPEPPLPNPTPGPTVPSPQFLSNNP